MADSLLSLFWNPPDHLKSTAHQPAHKKLPHLPAHLLLRAVAEVKARMPINSKMAWHRNTAEADLSLVTCSRCGGSVYEFGASVRGLERVVSRVSGCTTYSCYQCGRRGWLRHGRSNLGIAILARAVKVVIILAVTLAAAVAVFGVFMR